MAWPDHHQHSLQGSTPTKLGLINAGSRESCGQRAWQRRAAAALERLTSLDAVVLCSSSARVAAARASIRSCDQGRSRSVTRHITNDTVMIARRVTHGFGTGGCR